MKTRQNFSIMAVAAILAIAVMNGCGGSTGDGSSGASYRCVGTNERVSLGDRFAYGYLVEDKQPDAAARHLVNNCGWAIHEGHNGGVGDTLEVAKGNIVLIWAFGSFNGMVLSSDWTGVTNEGIRLGDSLALVLQNYPKAVRSISYGGSEYRLYAAGDSLGVEAAFDEKGDLRFLGAGFGSIYDAPSLEPFRIQNELDLSWSGEDIPGSWPWTNLIPWFSDFFDLKAPYDARYEDGIQMDDVVRFDINVTGVAGVTYCIETIVNNMGSDLGERKQVCGPSTASLSAAIPAYYEDFFSEYRLYDLAIIVTAQNGVIGEYTLSITCPGGVDVGNGTTDRKFCKIE